MGVRTSCSLDFTDRKSTPKLFTGSGGVSRDYVLSSTLHFLLCSKLCAQKGFARNCSRKRSQITQIYTKRLRLATSLRAPEEPPRVRPGNRLCLGGCRTNLIAHLLRTPQLRLPGLQERSAFGTTWKPGAASPVPLSLRPSARSRGGPASCWQVCQRKSPQAS